MEEGRLSESELSSLRWMARVNPDGIGLFGPTLMKHGPVEECESLVRRSLAKVRHERGDRGGYWITAEGRRVIGMTPTSDDDVMVREGK